jgi:hypothetical protein
MRLTFWFAEKGYELALGPALMAGAAAHGDEIEMRPLAEYRLPRTGGSIICGVVKREILWEHQMAGMPLLYMDKGYHRTRAPWGGKSLPGWWRLCWNATHPTGYLMDVTRPPDRWLKLGVKLAERRRGDKIILLGSSAKFHETERLPEPTQWAQGVIDTVRHISPCEITYRPKPSWAGAVAVNGASFDHANKVSVQDALAPAWCSITYGSISAVDSIVAGVPCIVLGNAVARPISGTSLSQVLDPYWAPTPRREQWAANLAYSHFTPAEIAAGTAWPIVKEQMRHAI